MVIDNYMGAEDMAGLEKAITNVRLMQCDPSEKVYSEHVVRVMREFDRMRKKLDEISGGKSTMILTDEDRAKPIQDLSDEALVAWVRPTIAFLNGVQEKREIARGIDALFMMSGVIAGARMCREANAGRMDYVVSGAVDKDGELGDWRIVIEHVDGPPVEEMIEALTADEVDSLMFLCQNPEADHVDEQFAVEVFGHWTSYKTMHYYGDTQYKALLNAHNARIKSNQ